MTAITPTFIQKTDEQQSNTELGVPTQDFTKNIDLNKPNAVSAADIELELQVRDYLASSQFKELLDDPEKALSKQQNRLFSSSVNLSNLEQDIANDEAKMHEINNALNIGDDDNGEGLISKVSAQLNEQLTKGSEKVSQLRLENERREELKKDTALVAFAKKSYWASKDVVSGLWKKKDTGVGNVNDFLKNTTDMFNTHLESIHLQKSLQEKRANLQHEKAHIMAREAQFLDKTLAAMEKIKAEMQSQLDNLSIKLESDMDNEGLRAEFYKLKNNLVKFERAEILHREKFIQAEKSASNAYNEYELLSSLSENISNQVILYENTGRRELDTIRRNAITHASIEAVKASTEFIQGVAETSGEIAKSSEILVRESHKAEDELHKMLSKAQQIQDTSMKAILAHTEHQRGVRDERTKAGVNQARKNMTSTQFQQALHKAEE